MRKIRIFSALLALLLAAGPVCSAAEVDSGGTCCFSPADFSEEEGLLGICITTLPEPGLGTAMLGSRVLRPGDILTAEQVSAMTFCPAGTETDCTAEVGYLPIFEGRVEAPAAMTIAIRGKVDKAPVAEDDALETYKNLPLEGVLKVSDPEGQPMTFTITRQGKRGSVEVREDGTFTYTPRKNKVGVDSFVYTATDPAGKVSREATVVIRILKPTDAAQYTDTLGKSCRFAAEWMKNTGIFVGETLAENACFSPEKAVSRGEFVTMLVKALDIPVEESLTHTGYTDEIPLWLQPYLAAAVRSGLTAGLPEQETFGADTAITGAEAGVLLQNALDITASAPVDADSDGAVPVWGRSALAAAEDHGLTLSANEVLTRGQAAQLLYQASRLQRQQEGIEQTQGPLLPERPSRLSKKSVSAQPPLMRGLLVKLTGGENIVQMFNIPCCSQEISNFSSPSVALGDSSLTRGSLGRSRARRLFDTLKGRSSRSGPFFQFSICLPRNPATVLARP